MFQTKSFFHVCLTLCCALAFMGASSPVHAQDTAAAQDSAAPLPPATVDMPAITLRWINKITARNKTINARVDQTVKIGDLYMKARACRNASPLESPESAAFVQIWEGGTDGQAPEWVFSGWMFASSPGLSAMDHPIYDVWVLSCDDGAHIDAVDALPAKSKTTQEVTP